MDQRTILPAAGCILIALAAISLAQTPARPLAFRNVRIFDGTGVIERGTVVVTAGKITAAAANAAVPAGAEVIDGTGKTLLPGLLDAHVHMSDSAGTAGSQIGRAHV